MFRSISFKDSFTIYPILLRPESRGEVTLRSSNPLVKPIIDQNYLDAQEDVNRLIEGAKIALKLIESEDFRKLGARFHFVPLPPCPKATPFSDEYFECLIRYYTVGAYHASGSVKMGPEEDPTSVVDPELRVHGIFGLRVADASIMPRIVSGDTNAPTVMIGERAAHLIKWHWTDDQNGFTDFIKYFQDIL